MTHEEDLWFLPGPLEEAPDDLPPGPRAEPPDTAAIEDWAKAEGVHAARLARVAGRLGALDDRLLRGPEGWRHRLALIEAADLSWFAGDRVSSDRLALWISMRLSGAQDDPNALALGTSNKEGVPSVRMVLLKGHSEKGFVFYTNLNSQKGNEIKENPNATMCFHWKSLLRQIRIVGTLKQVDDQTADEYYNSRAYDSRIGAWASKQSSILQTRDELLDALENYKKKYNDKDNVPRPSHWSGWNLTPSTIEFWLDGDNRIHERLKYSIDKNGSWIKSLLSP